MKVKFINSNLNFFKTKTKEIVFKTYAKTTENDQFVYISNLENVYNCPMDDFRIELSAFYDSDHGGTKTAVFSTRDIGLITQYTSNLRIDIVSGSSIKVAITESHLYDFSINAATGEVIIDNTTFASAKSTSSSKIKNAVLFAKCTSTDYSSNTSIAGVWKVKSFKIWKISANTLLAEIVPVTSDGVPCLYDKVTNTELYPNKGILDVE